MWRNSYKKKTSVKNNALQVSMSNVAAAADKLEPMAAIGQRAVVCAYREDRSRIHVMHINDYRSDSRKDSIFSCVFKKRKEKLRGREKEAERMSRE